MSAGTVKLCAPPVYRNSANGFTVGAAEGFAVGAAVEENGPVQDRVSVADV
jgi:hypothetical protein